MLDKNEEIDVKKLLYMAQDEYEATHIPTSDIILLCIRLLEINNECSSVTLELQKTNAELARFREHYEG